MDNKISQLSNSIQVELQEWMGNDRSIANAAWTSSFSLNKIQEKTDQQVADLVQRLAKDGHSTPFESVIFRFWIRMPIFTDRQHMTHRIASHNGLSGRYRTMPTDYYEIPDDVWEIFEKVENSNIGNPCPDPTWNLFDGYYQSCEIAKNNYSLGIEKLKNSEKQGVINNQEYKRAREIWRAQLPTAGFIERTTIMNLRSFANYYKLRSSPHAQLEIQEVARQMLNLIEEAQICPTAIDALKTNDWNI